MTHLVVAQDNGCTVEQMIWLQPILSTGYDTFCGLL